MEVRVGVRWTSSGQIWVDRNSTYPVPGNVRSVPPCPGFAPRETPATVDVRCPTAPGACHQPPHHPVDWSPIGLVQLSTYR